MMRIARWFLASVAVLLVLIVAGLWLAMRASLPALDGEMRLAGIASELTIERDWEGTPTITAKNRADLAFGTGYAHAQDRFFQMDLLRRAAAGELAALLGPTLVDTDKQLRVHGFRQVARQVVDAAPQSDRAILEAYVNGVNAGLSALGSRPWEYLVLASTPAPWQVEDSVLAAFSMYLSLNDSNGEQERARALLRETLPPDVFAFLHPFGTEWDAPIAGGVWRAAPIPSADVFDLRQRTATIAAPPSRLPLESMPFNGSNSWAAAASHTAAGVALLANDMHLGLRLPNTWYRARLRVDAYGDAARDLIGVTLPGLPLLIAGSNRDVAWGFTNSYGDWTDLVVVELDRSRENHYWVGEASEAIVVRREEIEVRGAPSEYIDVRMTRWGPIVAQDAQQRPLALAWTAHRVEATNLRMLDFERARNVNELLDAANLAGAPVQNVLAADTAGSIGWSLFGRVPARANYDPAFPASWREPGTGWIGWREPQEYPRIVDPATGRLWTANTRTIDAVRWLEFLGDGGHDLGARAAQIRDSLFATPQATAADFERLQLDDRALFLVRWRDLLLDLLKPEAVAASPARAEARELIDAWAQRASAEDAGYRIVREFRLRVRKEIFDAFTAEARVRNPDVTFAPSAQFEAPLWQLVTERPMSFLDPRFESWEEALLTHLDAVLIELKAKCSQLRQCAWGQRNRLQMQHPLSSALPFASRWLDMPSVPVPGDMDMPRVQGPQFGASQRIVVSPGREDEGTFQMPGGPVGHPLSPFYRAGHDAWVRGEPQPLLPGPPAHRLQLLPNS
jgi:penicillin amidase